MKTQFICITVLCATSLLYGADSRRPGNSKEKAETAVVLLNHLNWVVSRVEQNLDNPVVVEEEYENLTDNNINLATIEDEEIAHEIVALMRTFTGIRECIMDVDALHGTIELQRKAAIFKAIPNPGVVVSPNPYLIAIRLAESAATSFMNYQSAKIELQLKSVEKQLEIDKRKLNVLNAINEELFWRQWQIVQKYGLDDYWRTARRDCRELVSILSVEGDDSARMVYSYLKRNESRFAYLPIYWYYRMQHAMAVAGDTISENKEIRDDAIYCSVQFEKRHKNILRKDRICATVAMMRIGAEGTGISQKELERNLETIIGNLKIADWDLAYFVAQEYISIGQQEKAVDLLLGVVNDLEAFFRKYQTSGRKFDIASMRELKPQDNRDGKSPEERYAAFPSHGLSLCRSLLISTMAKCRPDEGIMMVEELLKDAGKNNVSVIEKLSYCLLFGKKIPRDVREALHRIAVHETKNGFRIGAIKPFMVGENEKIPVSIKGRGVTGKAFDFSPASRQANADGNHYDDETGDVICKTSGLKMSDFAEVSATLKFGGDENDLVFVFKAPFSETSFPTEVYFRKQKLP